MINKNKFSEVMARRTDDELFKIITIDKENYEADAVQAAEKEIENRNIDLQDATNLKEKYDNQSAEQIIESQKVEHAKSKRVSLFARMQNFAVDTLIIFFSFYIFLLVFEYLNLPMLDIISLIFLICTFFSYYIFPTGLSVPEGSLKSKPENRGLRPAFKEMTEVIPDGVLGIQKAFK